MRGRVFGDVEASRIRYGSADRCLKPGDADEVDWGIARRIHRVRGLKLLTLFFCLKSSLDKGLRVLRAALNS